MKKITLGLFILVVSLAYVVSSEAVKRVGGASQCDTTISGCFPPPVLTTLCLNPSTCSRITALDPSNANLMYGTDATNCRKSTNGGPTWSNCAANPSTAVLVHYAVNQDGEVLAAGNGPGGTTFIIQKSNNGGVSWSNVFSSATVDADNATVFAQRIACAKTSLICIAVYRSPASQLMGLSSVDGGGTWSSIALGNDVASPIIGVELSDDGSMGLAGVKFSDGVSNFKAALWNGTVWSLSGIWPNTAGAQCYGVLFYNADVAEFCKETAAATYTIRNYQGTILKTFTLPNGFTGLPTSYSGIMIGLNPGSDKPLAILGADNRVGSSIWISIDGTSFIQTNLLNDVGQGVNGQQSSAYLANGCGYFSMNEAKNPTGIVMKVC